MNEGGLTTSTFVDSKHVSGEHAVFVTQLVDTNDPLLGFVIRWVKALESVFPRVTVVANEVRSHLDGVAVVSLGKERSLGRARRTWHYLRAIERLTRDGRPFVLTHMCPDYANIAAPVTMLRGVPLLLWFAHPARTWELRLAEKLVDAILTSLPGSYPGESSKLRVIGQATDVETLVPSDLPPRGSEFRIAAIGRTSPSKGFETIIRAVGALRRTVPELRLRVVGPSSTLEEWRHRHELERLISRLDLGDVVRLEPGVPPEEVPRIIRESHALVNAMVAGSGDKVVFEAMALARPVIVSNPSFRALLDDLEPPLLFKQGDVEQLAARLRALVELEDARLGEVGHLLRRRVVDSHSLTTWARGVAECVQELRQR